MAATPDQTTPGYATPTKKPLSLLSAHSDYVGAQRHNPYIRYHGDRKYNLELILNMSETCQLLRYYLSGVWIIPSWNMNCIILKWHIIKNMS